jgi:hypothetical protein
MLFPLEVDVSPLDPMPELLRSLTPFQLVGTNAALEPVS